MLASPQFPSEILIEVTNDCNLRCTMCPRKSMTRKIGYMSFALFRNVIDQVTHVPDIDISLHCLGEPLMHPDIARMVKYAKDKKISSVGFSTNGLLLTDDLSLRLIDSGLDNITFSMDSQTLRYYDSRRNKSCPGLDKKILGFIALKKKLGLKKPKVVMQIMDIDSTKKHIDSFVVRWKKVADIVMARRKVRWAGTVTSRKKRNPSPQIVCVNQMKQAVIQWDGRAIACCLSEENLTDTGISLGDATTCSLEEIFLGKRRQEFLKELFRGNSDVAPSCKKCLEWVDYFTPLLYGKHLFTKHDGTVSRITHTHKTIKK